jgi:hypothetical protein
MKDAFHLQQLINSFVPTTLGEQLDMISAKLLMTIDLSNISQVNALKLSLSHTVDFVNGKIVSLFRQYLDDTFWEELGRVNVTLCAGMPATSKNLYQAMMTKSPNNRKLNKKIAASCCCQGKAIITGIKSDGIFLNLGHY